MPELPEVEIASRQLRGWLQGRRIASARAERSRVIRGQTQARFAGLAGHRLTAIERFGKWMLLSFDGGEGLLSHLGMTGKWIRRRADEPRPAHVRASLALDDGHAVDYRDMRLFGRLIRGKTEQLRALPALRATLAGEDSPEPITYVEEGGENVFLVYDRAGEPCGNCGTAIRRIVQGGRSTYYCPHCQPRWRARATSRTGPVRAPARASVALQKAARRSPARRLRVIQGGRTSQRTR